MKSLSISSLSLVLICIAIFVGGPNQAWAQKAQPNYATGEKAPSFTANSTANVPIRFPESYKGKVVLLDFWATWCGPCRAELPNVIAVYNKYHGSGFEVLGVSLDHPDHGQQLAQFTAENKMPWPQIYDGKYWKAAIAVRYGIHSIPRPILVDGTTGIVVAEGMNARGKNLDATVKKALAARK